MKYKSGPIDELLRDSDIEAAPTSKVRQRRQQLEEQIKTAQKELKVIQANCQHEDAYVTNAFIPWGKRCPHCGMDPI